MILLKIILISMIVTLLPGCGIFSKKAEDKNPLIITECPDELPQVQNDTFGATVKAAVQWATIYHQCRTAKMATTRQ